MLRGLRRIPAHVLNGLVVSIGIGLLQVAAAFSGPHGHALVTGAILASLGHQVDRTGRATRRAFVAGSLGCAAALLVAAAGSSVPAQVAAVAIVGFLSAMGTVYGPRAAGMGFASILSVVFTLAFPHEGSAIRSVFVELLGVVGYSAWVFVTTPFLEGRFRTLSVGAALAASAAMLRARADSLASTRSDLRDDTKLVDDESALAAKLDAARELVYSPRELDDGGRLLAILALASEFRDIAFASRLDASSFGDDPSALELRALLADDLRTLAIALAAEDARLTRGAAERIDLRGLGKRFANVALAPDDPRRRLVPVLEHRAAALVAASERIGALIDGADPGPAPSRESRLAFVTGETWPLATLIANLRADSPTARHALRTSVALGLALLVARALPWASHPHWIVLTVAVVLRGNLLETLGRRDARILGTALGCLVVLLSLATGSEFLLHLELVATTGIAHAFVGIRYLVTALAATVQSLLQVHFVAGTTSLDVVERLADTVLGSIFAWGFSYVVPSWERSTAPGSVASARRALAAYARDALTADAFDAQRRSRQQAYDSLERLALLVRRSSVEPDSVRVPTEPLVRMLLASHALMAHLSSIRFLIARHRPRLENVSSPIDLDAEASALVQRLEGVQGLLATSSAHAPPELPIEHAPRPWLERRLALAHHDAGAVTDAADEAMRRLARPV